MNKTKHATTSRTPKHEILWQEVDRLQAKPTPTADHRCVTLCRRILRLIHRSSHPQAWARATYGLLANLPDTPATEQERIRLWKFLLPVPFKSDPAKARAVRLLLGSAYFDRVHGQRQENLEKAIHYLQAAAQMSGRRARIWAMAHLQLGRAYTDRRRGSLTRNCRWALYHLQSAQTIFSRQRYPNEWAIVQDCRGRVLVAGPWLSEVRRRVLAIRCLEQTLQIRTKRSDQTGWAECQLNLAMNYYRLFFARGQGRPQRYDDPRDMKIAWRYIQKALEVYRQGIGSRRNRMHAQELEGRIARALHSRSFYTLKQLRLKVCPTTRRQ